MVATVTVDAAVLVVVVVVVVVAAVVEAAAINSASKHRNFNLSKKETLENPPGIFVSSAAVLE